MPVRATCPVCGVALFTPSDGYSAAAMVERHKRYGRCAGPLQVERSAVTDDDAREERRAAPRGRWA